MVWGTGLCKKEWMNPAQPINGTQRLRLLSRARTLAANRLPRPSRSFPK